VLLLNSNIFNYLSRCFSFFIFPVLFAVLVLSGCGTHTYHVVRPGDTLYSIGWAYGYDYKDLAAWNKISAPYEIRAGQIIRLTPPQRARSGNKSKSLQTGTKAHTDRNQVALAHRPGSAGRHTTTPKPSKHSTTHHGTVHAKKLTWNWPTEGKVVQFFTADNPRQKGLNIIGHSGQPVKAAAGGEVVYTGSGLIGYGKLIIIKHDATFLSAYAHNKTLLVKEGDHVTAGQKIAEMGSSGTNRVMLHFEIRRNGKPSDPLVYLPKRKL
jgi:lipoprotein NlpD